MPTTREMILREKYKEMLDKPMISIGDIDDLMDAVDRVLQNYVQTSQSRDEWKAKYKLRNNDAKNYAEEITRIKQEIVNLNNQWDLFEKLPNNVKELNKGGTTKIDILKASWENYMDEAEAEIKDLKSQLREFKDVE